MKYTLEIKERTEFRDIDNIPWVLDITYTTEVGYVGHLTVDKEGMTKKKITELVEKDIAEVGALHKATLGV